MVQELCEFGDRLLTEETAKVFKKEKDMKKGMDSCGVLVVIVYLLICSVIKINPTNWYFNEKFL